MNSAPPIVGSCVLGFADRRDRHGRYPVTDQSGAVVATIVKQWARSAFEANDAAGRPLCSGSLRFLGGWSAEDADRREIVSIGRGFFRVHRVVLPYRALDGQLRGAFLGRDWRVEDRSGQLLVTAVPHEAGWLFAPDAWLVRTVLTLAETVAITELHRLDLKRRRHSAAAAG